MAARGRKKAVFPKDFGLNKAVKKKDK